MPDQIKYYPLTHPQKAIWYMEKMYPGTSMGNIAGTLIFEGKVNFPFLEEALRLVIQNNESFQLRLTEVNGEPKQYLSDLTNFKIEFVDFSQRGGLKALQKWEEEQTRSPFTLNGSDLLYFAIVKIDEETGGWYQKLHHTISDAWTMISSVNQVVENYLALINGQEIDPKNKPPYLDFIKSEEEYKQSKRILKDKDFWDSKFETFPEIATLKPRTSNTLLTSANRVSFPIPKNLISKLNDYCEENKTSIFSVILASLFLYISRINSNEDIIVGTPILNRANAKEKDTLGMFASVAVPFRVQIDRNMDFKTLVETISKESISILRHQRYPYEYLVRDVRRRHKTSDNLFDIVFSYQNARYKKDELQIGFETRWHFNGNQIESLSINVNDREEAGKLIIDYDYLTDLFMAEEIKSLHKHLLTILNNGLCNPKAKVSGLDFLSKKEKNQLLYEFNNTEADYPQNKTVQQLFEEQVQRTPDKVALVYKNQRLTYRELNNRANIIANILKRKGVTPKSLVGIIVERSMDSVVGILGILKSGGAYLPIDASYPIKRKEYILQDANTKILIAPRRSICEIPFDKEILFLEEVVFKNKTSENLQNNTQPQDLAYVIYTSGSTGLPKGVMVEHRNVVRLLFNSKFQFDFNQSDIWSLFHSLSFDFSVWELFGALLYGGTLVVIPQAAVLDPKKFRSILHKEKVSVLNQTPSAFINLVNEELNAKEHTLAVKYIIFGGEALSPRVLKKWREVYPQTQLINMYGITETTVHVTYKEITDKEIKENLSNVGKPIPTLKAYILDESQNLLPIGAVGEICVSGDGVTRGYLNKPDLTRERFIPNPFVKGETIYRSGDLGKLLPNGEIVYIGRMDSQIQIKGFRVELGEIETQLLSHPLVNEAVVLAKETTIGRQFLCAYIVPKDSKISQEELKEFLSKELPYYMVPAYWVFIDKIPITVNGKIDKKALPEPAGQNFSDKAYVAPRDEIESRLAYIWEGVLEVEKVGIDDNFFALGGDSLAVIAACCDIFSDFTLDIQDFYSYPTIKELAELIRGAGNEQQPKIRLEDYPKPPQHNIAKIKLSGQKKPFGNVFLTGATGFLGSHILDELICTTDAKVFCLVRGISQENAEARLKGILSLYFPEKHEDLFNNRIYVINGDITTPNFGLSKEEYSSLGQKITTVIHSAAFVKHYGKYSEFEKTNIIGTQEAIKFSSEFNLRLNYISTVAVSGQFLVEYSEKRITFSENDFYFGQNFRGNVYVRSKFEAENAVLRAINEGLVATIYRIGIVTGRYSDGLFQKNINENAFYRMVKSFIELGLVPESMKDVDVEFSPVDLCAEAITKSAQIPESVNKVFHIYNHKEVSMGKLVNFFKSIGIDCQVVDDSFFKKSIKEILQDREKNKVLSGIIYDFNKDIELNFRVDINVESKITQEYLKRLGFEWNEIDKEYITKVLKYMIQVGYLQKI